MRPHLIKIVFLKELRELLRDRRSLIIMFGVPLVLYPVMMLGVGSVAKTQHEQLESQKNQIVIRNPAAAPTLLQFMADPDSQLAPSNDPAPEKSLATGSIQAILTIPDHAETRALAGDPTVKFLIQVDRSHRSTPFVEAKLDKLLNRYEKWIIERRLSSRGVSPNLLKGLDSETTDLATGQQRLGNLMAAILPLFLLITGMLGAFFPALAVTTTEREHGTLETLLVSPAGRTELLVAKGALVLLTALLTAGLNMLSMSLVMWRMFSMIPDKMGANLDLNFSLLALSYLAAVPTLIFFSGIVLVVGLMARTYREASSLATPVMLLPVISMVVGLAEPKISPGVLLTPIANTTVIIREVLVGRATFVPFAVAFAASCLYAGLLVSAAARVFSNEQLVNPGWEPLSLKGLGRQVSAKRKRRLPSIDAVLALFSLSVLLNFYLTPSLADWPFLALLATIEIGTQALPALAAAYLARWRWRETFSFFPAPALSYIGALLLGLGSIPVASFLMTLQNKLWPAPPDYFQGIYKILATPAHDHPFLTTLLVGLLAGVCEELLYRGPIQSALLRKLPSKSALLIGAVLFSAAHVDAHGFLTRALLGLLLGYTTLRTRSIFPSMLLHATFDSTQTAYLAWQTHHDSIQNVISHSSTPDPLNLSLLLPLAIGLTLLLTGYFLLRPSRNLMETPTPIMI